MAHVELVFGPARNRLFPRGQIGISIPPCSSLIRKASLETQLSVIQTHAAGTNNFSFRDCFEFLWQRERYESGDVEV